MTEDEVSIVNKKAGTTRDVVSKIFSLDGVPVTIFDTAGIRDTNDSIEKEGRERALKQAASANIVVYLYNVSDGIDQEDIEILSNIRKANENILVAANKIDLIEKEVLEKIKANNKEDLFISIKENINMNMMRNKILEYLKSAIKNSSSGLYNIKNIEHLNQAYQEIDGIQINLNELELIAEKLKMAQKNISMVLDNNDDERVLSGIFSNFCIGK